MEAYQQRVIDEKKELDIKRMKLSDFIANPAFESLDAEDRKLLLLQRHAMEDYSEILANRIARFPTDGN